MKKKFTAIILCIAAVFALSVGTFADNGEGLSEALIIEDAEVDINYDAIKIMVSHGIPESIAKVLPVKRQIEIANAILENPENVLVSSTILEVDNLAELEAFYSHTADELISMGADPVEIDKTKEKFDAMAEQSVDELAKKLNISAVEAAMIHMAIDAGKEELNREQTQKEKAGVCASGSITSSEMTYSQLVNKLDYYDSPHYYVELAFTWKEFYYVDILTDKIAANWGGNLNTETNLDEVNYFYADAFSGFGNFLTVKSMDLDDESNSACTYSFPQSYDGARAKQGYASFILYQTQTQGYDTKIVSRYGHQIIGIGGLTITFGYPKTITASVTFGAAYDQTPQQADNIGY